ncbi:exodeoxyribonuclease III [archaeon]|jgi:exodeoxyribonuclease III|nr:exodeoxyribonuclease III [archaeon]
MKLLSWNVNGIRACINKGFFESMKKLNPDVICLQEIKAHPEQVDMKLKDYEHHFWNSAERKGYSGVAVFSKIKPLSVNYGIGLIDEEGRVITLEFKDFYLVTVYTPNSKPELERLDFRYKEWDKKFLEHVKSLKKPTIFCGDLNVAHEEIDLKNPKPNQTTKTRPGNAGFTDKERKRFKDFLDAGYIDTFRHFYKDKIQYSWWSYRFQARTRNVGWRLDYFLADKKLKSKLKDAKIHDKVLGSDHCPVSLELKSQ